MRVGLQLRVRDIARVVARRCADLRSIFLSLAHGSAFVPGNLAAPGDVQARQGACDVERERASAIAGRHGARALRWSLALLDHRRRIEIDDDVFSRRGAACSPWSGDADDSVRSGRCRARNGLLTRVGLLAATRAGQQRDKHEPAHGLAPDDCDRRLAGNRRVGAEQKDHRDQGVAQHPIHGFRVPLLGGDVNVVARSVGRLTNAEARHG